MPIGSYPNVWAVLKKDDAEALANLRRPVTLKEIESPRLPFGGPLKSTVAVTRGGGYLRLDYQVLYDGLAYRMLKPEDQLPVFTVYKGDQRLAFTGNVNSLAFLATIIRF